MDVDFTTVGRLLSNRVRSRMVGTLLEGQELTVSELAHRCGVAPSTASEHLKELEAGGLLRSQARGRHRVFRLATGEVADGLEALTRICPAVEVRSLRASSEARALHAARTCYDHVAGLLGVGLLDAMVAARWLEGREDAVFLGAGAEKGFGGLGIDLEAVRRSRRPFIRTCVDWTVRRPHLSGALGAAVCAALLDKGWVVRGERRRGLVVTGTGAAGLRSAVGFEAGGQGAV
jgi:DNA-binding transcriptional ArsR family regulator